MEERTKRLSDSELTTLINEEYEIQPMMLHNEPIEKKETLLKETLKIESVSTRQLARIIGISVNSIWTL